MTLPSGYGKNALMKLKLVDPQQGIYETTRGDRQFQISIDANGNISVKAANVDLLKSKLDANIEKYRAAMLEE